MKKSLILSQLKIYQPEQLVMLKRIIDLCNHAEAHHEIQTSDFISPDLLGYIPQILGSYRDLSYRLEGGYEMAEYQRLTIYPDYLYDVPSTIDIIEMSYQEQYGSIGHRDVLGAVLGLGIKREVIGDIIVGEGKIQLMATKEISSYIMDQISKIGRVTVACRLISQEELMATEPEFKLIFATVKSLRLDAIMAQGYQMARSKATQLIKAEQVKVNHNYIHQVSKEIAENDLISVRGHGRIRLEGVNGLSKKDRYKITIKKYV